VPIYLDSLDISEPIPDDFAHLRDQVGDHPLPAAVVHYPNHFKEDPPAMVIPFSRDAMAGLLQSPARKQIAEHIVAGESVVFALLTSPDPTANTKARVTAEKNLARLAEHLELPQLTEDDFAQHIDETVPIELKLSFKLVTIDPADEAEAKTVKLLTSYDPSIKLADGPQLFAFFGRGRVIGPIPHTHIDERTLYDVCSYLVGACSCQVKADNPGWDMLLSVDWDQVVQGQLTLGEAMPPLTTPAAALERVHGMAAATVPLVDP